MFDRGKRSFRKGWTRVSITSPFMVRESSKMTVLCTENLCAQRAFLDALKRRLKTWEHYWRPIPRGHLSVSEKMYPESPAYSSCIISNWRPSSQDNFLEVSYQSSNTKTEVVIVSWNRRSTRRGSKRLPEVSNLEPEKYWRTESFCYPQHPKFPRRFCVTRILLLFYMVTLGPDNDDKIVFIYYMECTNLPESFDETVASVYLRGSINDEHDHTRSS